MILGKARESSNPSGNAFTYTLLNSARDTQSNIS